MVEAAIEARLKTSLGVGQVLWLRDGYLAGDDTDGHIDMLARFCDPTTIAYVAPPTWEDEHKAALSAMETSLKAFTTKEGHPYRLIPLPMATLCTKGMNAYRQLRQLCDHQRGCLAARVWLTYR
jgi:agmatine deiminase